MIDYADVSKLQNSIKCFIFYIQGMKVECKNVCKECKTECFHQDYFFDII